MESLIKGINLQGNVFCYVEKIELSNSFLSCLLKSKAALEIESNQFLNMLSKLRSVAKNLIKKSNL